jgi:hypothetical protein
LERVGWLNCVGWLQKVVDEVYREKVVESGEETTIDIRNGSL